MNLPQTLLLNETPLTTSVLAFREPHRAEIAEGLYVGRVLPFRGGRGVGPFVFLDHIGPHTFGVGQGTDVLSHPHIGLSTVTYLFEGFLDHRDSLGKVQRIAPGDVNWMTAGRGIVHSERSPPDLRNLPQPFHGLQAWVELPVASEEADPSFEHVGKNDLPQKEVNGVRLRLVAGNFAGMTSPVRTHSRLFYVDCEFAAGSILDFNPEGQEAAFFLVSGTVSIDEKEFKAPGLIHFVSGKSIRIQAGSEVRGLALGGEGLTEHRRIWWNFVSSRPERIEEAKRAWREREFPEVPGETGFVPLPSPKN